MKELILTMSYVVYSLQSCYTDNLNYYAGQNNESISKYDSIGLPTDRKWLTHAEWHGKHIKNKVIRSKFSTWKKNYRETFIKDWIKYAIAESKVSKIPPSIIVSQAILESNWGVSMLAKKANNYFGHKYRGKNKNFIFAKDDSPNDKFTKYPSVWWCVRKHSKILNGRYKKRLKGHKTNDWLEALCGGLTIEESKRFVEKGNSVYATSCFKRNPCYSEKLKRIIKTYKLYKYD